MARLCFHFVAIGLLQRCPSRFPAATLAPLQRMFHAAARLVLVLDLNSDHVTPALRELHWLPIVQRIDYRYKLCLVVHKSSIGQAPAYIANVLTAAGDGALRHWLFEWQLHCTSSLFCDQAFSVTAPRAWNRLPADLKTASCSTEVFKHHLKAFLFNCVYCD